MVIFFFWLFVLKVGDVWLFLFNYVSKSRSLPEKKEKTHK